jgi:type IV pilus assembly protein PilB
METISSLPLTTEVQQLISIDQAWYYSIIPKESDKHSLTFYVDNQKNLTETKDELTVLFGKNIILEPTDSELINKTLGKHYRKAQKILTYENIPILNNDSEDFLVNLLTEANSIGSSDIHIEIYEESCRIRMRIDGKLIERYILEQKTYPSLINKIKIKASLDIAEKRLPQDGRIFFIHGENKFDIRVSILPTLYGEKIVLRLLSKDATNIEINSLGFNSIQLEQFLHAIQKPHGIVLISGPTGSGKTTTLYATLKILNIETTNIITIEDPVEYTLKGINQVQLKENIGLTFSNALRTFLRQDPDIIMLGEIRDGETAQIAIRAALTGHLVLSTIHTNSAWGTITRLIDMGVPSFLLASTINLTAAQRLVRLLCPKCKEKLSFETNLYPNSFNQPRIISHHFVPRGCNECFYTGYKGRKAIYEIINIDGDLSELIRQGKQIDAYTIKQKMITTLSDAAFSIFESGETSIEEVYSIFMSQIG